MAIMTSVHRVVVSQDTYKALQAEAMVRHIGIQAVMDSIIIENISQPAKEILKTLSTIEHSELKAVGIIEHMDKPARKPQSHKDTMTDRPKQLAKDEAAVARVKELYANSDMPIAEIARQIDRPRQTVEALIDRLIERKELAERPKPTS
jgi:hypothetical protein